MTTKINNLYLNIHGVTVSLSLDNNELLNRLEKDFSYFKTSRAPSLINIKSLYVAPDFSKVEGDFLWKRKNQFVYQKEQTRYINYSNKLISVYTFDKEEGVLKSNNMELLHEITYLLVLSRVGKRLDLQGVHRLHAMAINLKDQAILALGKSGLGKSTLCKNLLQRGELISDDTPLINTKGELIPFPIRLGFSEKPSDIDESFQYTMERREYGKKFLVDSKAFNICDKKKDKYSILILKRGDLNSLKKAGVLKSSLYLFRDMVIGLGTPIIFEYFWERGVQDFFMKTRIFMKRFKLLFLLLRKADFYILETNNEKKAIDLVNKHF